MIKITHMPSTFLSGISNDHLILSTEVQKGTNNYGTGRCHKEIKGRIMNKYTINQDRMGNIIITNDYDTQELFYQAESDKDMIMDILNISEKEEFDAGWDITINFDEPRASILEEMYTNNEEL